MRRWPAVVIAVVVAVAAAPRTARAQSYIEKFVGWSKDHSFYLITQSGTDEVDFPTFCIGHRGDPPASWPKTAPKPAADDDRGCTDLDIAGDPVALLAQARPAVVAPTTGATGPHGETVAVRAVADKSIVEVAVSRANKSLGRAYFFRRNGAGPAPDLVTSYWRDDGLAVAVEAGYTPAKDPGPGFGPPRYLVIVPLDGSTANATRPHTVREQSSAMNITGMQMLGAKRLGEAQADFTAASTIDPTYSIPLYNLASVASLRHDAGPAVVALLGVIVLARTDAEAARAVAHGKTDHDLDFIASQSPYVTQLLGRPRVAGDDWCIAAETRARDINTVRLDSVAEAAGKAVDATAYASMPADKPPEITCFVRDGHSQLSIELTVGLRPKTGAERVVSVAWELFPEGLFDADVFLDDAHTKTASLKTLDRVVQSSQRIIGK